MTCAAMMRDCLLMEEFIRRGIDITEVCDGDRLWFKHMVVLNESRTKLCLDTYSIVMLLV